MIYTNHGKRLITTRCTRAVDPVQICLRGDSATPHCNPHSGNISVDARPGELNRYAAMLHFHYVGHFDPLELVALSRRDETRPALKVLRPLPMSAVDRALASYPEIACFIEYHQGGYAICHWSSAPRAMWETIHEYAEALARAEDAILMNEGPAFSIEYPPSARETQRKLWANFGM